MNITKNLKNLKSTEFIDTAAKRALINGMTMSYAERYLDMKRSALIILSNQLTANDYKELQGSSPADAICKEAQEVVKECFKEGKSAKWIAQQTKLPSNVVRAIEKDAGIVHASTAKTTKVETPEPKVLIEETKPAENMAEKKTTKEVKRSYRKYDEEMCELIYHDAVSGKTRKEIAADYGIPLNSVNYMVDAYRKKHDIKTFPLACRSAKVGSRNATLTDDQVIKISDLIVSGYSNSEISDILDIPTYKIADIRGKRTYRSLTKDYNFTVNDNLARVFSEKTIRPETVKAIVNMLMEGKPNIDIARTLGIGANIVCMVRNKTRFKSFTKGLEFPTPMACEVVYKPNDHNSHCEHGPYNRHNNDNDNDVPYELVTEIVEVPAEGKTYVDVVPTEEPIVTSTEREVSVEDNTDIEESDAVNDYLNGDYAESPVSEDTHEETHEEEIKVIDVKNNQHQYFGNIAKAFAADRAAVISTRDDQIVSYIVANTIEECMIRMISLLTPEEIAGTNLYVSGKYNDMTAIVNMAKIIKADNMIIK